MKKFECRTCGDKCIVLTPDEMKDPEYCPVDSMRAKWRQVIRVEVVADGVAPRF